MFRVWDKCLKIAIQLYPTSERGSLCPKHPRKWLVSLTASLPPSLGHCVTWEAPIACATRVPREPGSLPVPKLGCGLTSLPEPSWYCTAISRRECKEEERAETTLQTVFTAEEKNTSGSLAFTSHSLLSLSQKNSSLTCVCVCVCVGGVAS